MNLSNVVVRNKNGAVDTKASVTAFKAELDSLIAAEKTESAVFEDAAHAAFDKYPGTAISMPALCAAITVAMNAEPVNHAALTERARKYIQNNSVGEKSIFTITKGKGGGVRRRSDIPVES